MCQKFQVVKKLVNKDEYIMSFCYHAE